MVKKTIHLIMVAPPWRLDVEETVRAPSALLYVGGHLKKHGYRVKVHHITRSQIDEVVETDLVNDDALFIGFSVFTGRQVGVSAEMSLKIKATRPSATIVWGGIHPSLVPKECLDFGCIDYVVVGEGENTAAELADFLGNGSVGDPETIKGIAFKKNGRFILTPPREFETDLDSFRQDWSLVNIKKYAPTIAKEKRFSFISSRGCPHSCGFCYNQAFNRRRWRPHSIDFVVDELVKIKEQTGVTSVQFDDDNFFTNRKRGLEIIERLRQQGIRCHAVTLRFDYVTEDFLLELRQLGVSTIQMGLESGSLKTLKKIKKSTTPELIMEKIRILAKFKEMTVVASAIVGFPWETEADIEETTSILLNVFRIKPFKVEFHMCIYAPYPGSPIVDEALAKGFSFPTDYAAWEAYDYHLGKMTLPWLDELKRRRLVRFDSYAKLLYALPKGWPGPVRLASYALALLAYARLRTGMLSFPVEVWAYNSAYRTYWKRRNRRATALAKES